MTEIKTNGPDNSFANVPYPPGTEPSPFANVPLPHPSGREPNAFDSLPPLPQPPADGSPVSWGSATIEGPSGQPEPWWVEPVRQREALVEPAPQPQSEWWEVRSESSESTNPFAAIEIPEQTSTGDTDPVAPEVDYTRRELELAPIPESFIPKEGVEVKEPEGVFHINGWREAGLPIPPEQYDRLAKTAQGWKGHLNFNYKDPEVVRQVQEWFDKLSAEGLIAGSKIGNGGGAEADELAAGKEATFAVGHRDTMQIVAERATQELGHILLPMAGHDVLEDDIPIAENVWGRFDVERIDQDFVKYGGHGYQMLRADIEQIIIPGGRYKGLEGQPARSQFWQDALVRTKSLLEYRYGEFFTGTQAA